MMHACNEDVCQENASLFVTVFFFAGALHSTQPAISNKVAIYQTFLRKVNVNTHTRIFINMKNVDHHSQANDTYNALSLVPFLIRMVERLQNKKRVRTLHIRVLDLTWQWMEYGDKLTKSGESLCVDCLTVC